MLVAGPMLLLDVGEARRADAGLTQKALAQQSDVSFAEPQDQEQPEEQQAEAPKSNRLIKNIEGLDYPGHEHSDSTRYITYLWNSGRLNNQIRSFDSAMAYARYYNRTLIIPRPTRDNEVTGLYYGLWDLHYLRQHIDFALWEDVPQHILDLIGEPRKYNSPSDIPDTPSDKIEECWVDKHIKTNIPKSVSSDCVVIFLKHSRWGVFRFDGEMDKVHGFLRPAKYILNAVEDFTKRNFPEQRIRVCVHNRAMKEGGMEGTNPYMCRWKRMSVHSGRPDGIFVQQNVQAYVKQPYALEHGLKREDILNVYYESCAMNWASLGVILDFHHVEMPSPEEHFFLGDDGTAPEIKTDLVEHGAILWQQDEFSKISRAADMVKLGKEQYNCKPKCFGMKTYQRLEMSILDMQTFSACDFFVGSWMSTFTETACWWRGVDRRYNSSLCFFRDRWTEATKNKQVYK